VEKYVKTWLVVTAQSQNSCLILESTVRVQLASRDRKSMVNLGMRNSILVEQLLHHPKVEGLSLTSASDARGGRKS
jgi:hypothetical protein